MILVQLLTGVIMARKTKRAALVLADEQRAMLTELSGSRTAPIREVERAKILLGYAEGASISGLMRRVGVGRPMIYKCIDKALAAGVGAGLKDAYHRPHEPEITDEAKAWVVSIACTNRKIMDWRPNCGRFRHWRGSSAKAPRRLGIHVWRKRARVPSGEF